MHHWQGAFGTFRLELQLRVRLSFKRNPSLSRYLLQARINLSARPFPLLAVVRLLFFPQSSPQRWPMWLLHRITVNTLGTPVGSQPLTGPTVVVMAVTKVIRQQDTLQLNGEL